MNEKNFGSHIAPERMDRFTWHDGEIKALGTKEEVERQAEKEGRNLIWYDRT